MRCVVLKNQIHLDMFSFLKLLDSPVFTVQALGLLPWLSSCFSLWCWDLTDTVIPAKPHLHLSLFNLTRTQTIFQSDWINVFSYQQWRTVPFFHNPIFVIVRQSPTSCCMNICMYIYMWGTCAWQPKVSNGGFFLLIALLLYTQRQNFSNWLVSLASLVWRSFISTLWGWNYRMLTMPTQHLHGCRVSKLWSSCLHSKCFNY